MKTPPSRTFCDICGAEMRIPRPPHHAAYAFANDIVTDEHITFVFVSGFRHTKKPPDVCYDCSLAVLLQMVENLTRCQQADQEIIKENEKLASDLGFKLPYQYDNTEKP